MSLNSIRYIVQYSCLHVFQNQSLLWECNKVHWMNVDELSLFMSGLNIESETISNSSFCGSPRVHYVPLSKPHLLATCAENQVTRFLCTLYINHASCKSCIGLVFSQILQGIKIRELPDRINDLILMHFC